MAKNENFADPDRSTTTKYNGQDTVWNYAVRG
jgi:hypothetical protein